MGKLIRPSVTTQATRVHDPHPIAQAMASALGALYGRDIRGQSNGAVRIGESNPYGGRYAGYVTPQQLFVGWNPRKVAAGAIRNGGSGASGLPGTQAPAGYRNPVLDALASANTSYS